MPLFSKFETIVNEYAKRCYSVCENFYYDRDSYVLCCQAEILLYSGWLLLDEIRFFLCDLPQVRDNFLSIVEKCRTDLCAIFPFGDVDMPSLLPLEG